MIISTETKWVIMDKKRGIIARGVPRNRRLTLLNGKSKARILTYNSKKTCENAFNSNWFYIDNDVRDYISNTYRKIDFWDNDKIRELLETVEVKITVAEGQ